eukprot:gene4950-6033_t
MAENEAQRDTTLSESFTEVLAIESEVYKSLNDWGRGIGIRERVESFLYLHFVSQLKEKLGEDKSTGDLDLDGQDERVEDEEVEEPVELGASEGEGGDDWEDAADRGDFDNSDFLTCSEGNGSRLLSHEETADFDESALRAALGYTKN